MSVSANTSEVSKSPKYASSPLPQRCLQDACVGCDVPRRRRRFSSTDDTYFSCDGTEYQETVISKSCEAMYSTWKRRSWPLQPSSDQSFSEFSRDGKFAIGRIGKEGGYLELRDRDIQLYIPPGAMPDVGDEHEYEYVFLYVDTVKCDLINYDVIICGPPGLKFNSSVLLRFPNSKPGCEEPQERPTKVKLSLQQLGKPMEWRSLNTNIDGFFFLEDDDVILYLNHFTGIKVNVGAQTIQTMEEQQSKPIYVAAFLEQCDQRYFYLRVFFSTHSALTLVNKEESDNASRKIGNPVKGGSYGLRDEVKVKIFDCVDCKTEPSEHTVPVSDIVSDDGYISRQCVVECCSNEASLKFQVAVGNKNVHLAHVKANRTRPQATVKRLHKKELSRVFDEYQEAEFTHSPLIRPILSNKLRRRLSMELDVPTLSQRRGEREITLCDYRGLACLMEMPESFINWIGAPKNCQTSSSPTNLLFNSWEINCRKRHLTDRKALEELESLLMRLEHQKCISIMCECLRSRPTNKGQQTDQLRPRLYSAPEAVLNLI